LETWEIVHHKDKNKENDNLENLEILNDNLHAEKHHQDLINKKPSGWKPVNTLQESTIKRINELASEMIRINCSEISRKLKKEGINACPFTVKRYLIQDHNQNKSQ
jgi:hypothetical protein